MKKRRLREQSEILSFSPWLMQELSEFPESHSRFASLKTRRIAIVLGFFFFFAPSSSADFTRSCWSGGRRNTLYNEIKPRDHPYFLSVTWVEGPSLPWNHSLCLGSKQSNLPGWQGRVQLPSMFSSVAKLVAYQPLLLCHQSTCPRIPASKSSQLLHSHLE